MINNIKKIFAYCAEYLSRHKWKLALYIIIGLVASLLSLVSPYIMGNVIDYLVRAESIDFLFRYFAIFALINVSTLLLGYIMGRLYVRLQNEMGYALNRDIVQRLQRVPLRAIQHQDTAYLNQRINNDANGLVIFCISFLQSVIVNAFMIVIPAVLLTIFHPILAGVLLGVAVLYFVFYILYRRVLYRVSFAFQESQSHFFSKLYEQLFNIRFIKIHSLFNSFVHRLNSSFSVLLSKALRYQHTNYIFGGLDQLVVMVVQMILLIVGGREVILGQLTIGRFIIISTYFNMMLGAMRYFLNLGQSIQSSLVSYNRLRELSDIETENNGVHKLESVDTIEIKNLSFAYDSNVILANMSLKLEKGNIYAIIGSNGAGKSTLIDILMGLQIGNFNGKVLFNGIDMLDVDMYDLRKRLIGVSEQEPTLLTDTLEYNINQDSERPLDNCTASHLVGMLGLEAYFNTLPNGYKTIINESATNISGGEKQKLSILRALATSPNIIILDEPTSALDAISGSSLRNYLNEVKNDKIIIVVTHDSDFIAPDTVIVRL